MTDCTWISDTDQNSDVTAAWDVAPGAGDNLIFTSDHVGKCTINQAVTFGNISLGAGCGSVLQGAVNIGYVSLSQLGGAFTGNSNYKRTVSGNEVSTAGIYNGAPKLVMTGDGSVINVSNAEITNLRISANIQLQTNPQVDSYNIDAGKVLQIIAGKTFVTFAGVANTNLGEIAGPGLFCLTIGSGNISQDFGKVTAPMQLYKASWASVDTTVKATADLQLWNLLLDSQHPTLKANFDLNGHKLNGTRIEIGVRGALASSVPGSSMLLAGPGSKFVAMGDSITYGAASVVNYTLQLQNIYPYYTAIQKGVGGNTTAQMVARFTTDVLNNTPGVVIIMGGTNDMTSVVTATIEANLNTMYQAAISAGIKVIACTITPFNGVGANLQKLLDVNNWIRGQASANITVADTFAAIQDPANENKILPAYDYGDGLHLNTAGQLALANCMHSVYPSAPYEGITVAATASFDRTNISMIRADGPVDLSAGTSVMGTETWVFGGGPGQVVKLAAGQKLYNAIFKARSSSPVLTNVTIDNLLAHVNPVSGATLTKPENEYTGLRRPMVRNLTKLDLGQLGLADGWLADMGALL